MSGYSDVRCQSLSEDGRRCHGDEGHPGTYWAAASRIWSDTETLVRPKTAAEAAQIEHDLAVDRLERACEVMHDAYEKAAAEVGWETQERSRKPWIDVPEANKATMRAAVSALLKFVDTH